MKTITYSLCKATIHCQADKINACWCNELPNILLPDERIMDIQPDAIHQRVAVILGSKNEVETCLSYHK